MSELENQQHAHQDDNQLIQQRREKLAALRAQGNAFPNEVLREHKAADLHAAYGEHEKEWFEANEVKVSVAGRVMLRRMMGKASFATVSDTSGRIQVYVQLQRVGEASFDAYKHQDIGDIIAVEGVLFKTQTGELSVKANTVRLLTKSLRPLPEKFHGLTDQEQRYRQRYIDLIMNEESRNTFRMRSKIISYIRNFFTQRDYMEVETPMLQVIPGGASARPFITHHNALDLSMYLRIAPELYLKRLVVGGFERVFEINRNFRNEGVSVRHNPEFTMIEFYQAYATYIDMMDLTEALFKGLAADLLGSTEVPYQGQVFDFAKPFERITIRDAILKYNPDVTTEQIDHLESARVIAKQVHAPIKDSDGLGKVQVAIFEETVEHLLQQPTFVMQHPAEVSPLARLNDENPFVTDRFEFYIGGREIGNGFSELNDAEDQAERFLQQVREKEAGDDEAMFYDADFVRALEYGMPPTAGEGIGIDRLVMLFTDAPSIRDVILFPHMRPE
ncbi:lysine--tRNA ligase [uncultured Thiothrix sp.]|uniref:lysine--tRNA ligase n=1 Tax=uncultured Thiothrix sp. TaxID=223185 RepID=UPI002637B0FE|nr:lysine--tRNA ligase [uncultured Thiothrix sp.]HMT92898.1 lysine--tRNA ligase [Thiolinea sp.]